MGQPNGSGRAHVGSYNGASHSSSADHRRSSDVQRGGRQGEAGEPYYLPQLHSSHSDTSSTSQYQPSLRSPGPAYPTEDLPRFPPKLHSSHSDPSSTSLYQPSPRKQAISSRVRDDLPPKLHSSHSDTSSTSQYRPSPRPPVPVYQTEDLPPRCFPADDYQGSTTMSRAAFDPSSQEAISSRDPHGPARVPRPIQGPSETEEMGRSLRSPTEESRELQFGAKVGIGVISAEIWLVHPLFHHAYNF
jgi:hypothetical protein